MQLQFQGSSVSSSFPPWPARRGHSATNLILTDRLALKVGRLNHHKPVMADTTSTWVLPEKWSEDAVDETGAKLSKR